MTALPRFVLCVDDDEDDRLIVSETIGEVDPHIEVVHATNGLEAIHYLSKAKIDPALFPCLVILDINMPLMDGKQTLATIKKDEELKHLPIVLFSTSNSPMDKLFCEVHGVELITKPSNLLGIKKEVSRLLQHCA
ncbi:MAG TPA: response regulator [Chitinophagaceae bacterium]|jgi:CheY-like chemotaxis protein|nr:response regulator [Chitinophagaceae bacterium]